MFLGCGTVLARRLMSRWCSRQDIDQGIALLVGDRGLGLGPSWPSHIESRSEILFANRSAGSKYLGMQRLGGVDKEGERLREDCLPLEAHDWGHIIER